jgi:hypothetical protein
LEKINDLFLGNLTGWGSGKAGNSETNGDWFKGDDVPA